jgi:NADPH-dependent 2,4-dienoyl-CoA reductase/sulfur reductase-like enzyme
MKSDVLRYVIIGNGVAGITAAFTLRQREPGARITVISGETDYFFSRTALMYSFMGRMTQRDLEPYERKVYDQRKIERMRDWVTDLDARAQTLRLESGGSIQYDRLLLATGSAPNRVAWPGLRDAHEGVVHFVAWQDLEECERFAPSSKNAVVVGGGLIGIEMVECLVHLGIKVTFLIREPWYWPIGLNASEADTVSTHVRRHNVEIRRKEEIAEVRSLNGRVTSVRTESGQNFACDFLAICIGVHPAIGWLRDVATPPQLGHGVRISSNFATSLPNIWAAGDCAEIAYPVRSPLVEQHWYAAKRQGELAARSMLGDAVSYEPPVPFRSAKFFDIEYTSVGTVADVPQGALEFYSKVNDKKVSMRAVEFEGRVIGFNLLGSRWEHTVLERWIAERRTLEYAMANLEQAQFDPEFGRESLWRFRRDYDKYKQTLPGAVVEYSFR